MNPLKLLRTRSGFRHSVAILAIGALAILAAYLWEAHEALFLIPLITVLWWSTQMCLIGSAMRTNRLLNSGTAQRDELKKLAENEDRIETRIRAVARQVSDIAGTTGRSAALIRDLHKGKVTSAEPAHTSTADTILAPQSLAAYRTSDAIRQIDRQCGRPDINVMIIADKFTEEAFGYEWNQVSPTPENCLEMLDSTAIDFLFVESAWDGNGGAWRYHLVGQSAPRPALVELVEKCREKGIPTVFWNKEDPPHYDDFLPTAKLFDIVLTTEAGLIETYKKEVGHDKVFLLPFAAQPVVHNPAKLNGIQRKQSVVFGGMYFREKYPERRAQMDYLLPAASPWGLDVYSRNTTEQRYQFPEPYAKMVKGSLSYPEMIAAYHAYKVALNVNSVPHSTSMCARRIFEATACGAAVVSPPTDAIDNYFTHGVISQVEDEETAKSVIRALVRSDEFRDRLVHQAQRQVWESHCYSHRVDKILSYLGLPVIDRKKSVAVIISTIRKQCIDDIVANLERQLCEPFEVAICTHGFTWSEDEVGRIASLPTVGKLTVIPSPLDRKLGENLNILVDSTEADFIVRMDDDDWYGPHYVTDLRHAADYSGAALVGKAETYIYFEEKNATVLTNIGHEHRYTQFVRGATFAGPRQTFERFPFKSLSRSEDSTFLREICAAGLPIYSADRFNFVVNRRKDKTTHTWGIADTVLFATGDMRYSGNAQDQVDV